MGGPFLTSAARGAQGTRSTTFPSKTSLRLPGRASATQLGGINDAGTAIGSGKTFKPIQFPGAVSTFPTSINDTGAVAGWYDDGTTTQDSHCGKRCTGPSDFQNLRRG